MKPRPLADVLGALVDGDDAPQVAATFGPGPRAAIEAEVRAHVLAELGRSIVACSYAHVSAGVTLELVLDDERRVVLKAVAAEHHARVHAAVEVQRVLAEAGYPAPRPLAPARRGRGASLQLMEACDRGEAVTCDRRVSRTLAAEYARLVPLARVAPIASMPDGRPPRDRLWPTPHSVIFDFEATSRTAAPIDAVAVAARAVVDADEDPLVVAHADWSLHNVAMRQGRLVGTFDWDSIRRLPETLAVAGAAAFHAQDWRRGPDACAHDFYPGPATTLRFVRDYESARGRPFSSAQWACLRAGLVLRLAYQARCEHALDPATEGPAVRRLFAFAEAFEMR